MRTQLEHLPQKSGKPSVVDRRKTIQRLRQHERQRVLPRTGRPCQNHRLGKVVARQHLAQAVDHVGVAVKVSEQRCQLSAKQLAISNWHLVRTGFAESSRLGRAELPLPIAFY